jgi:hypothetical protein
MTPQWVLVALLATLTARLVHDLIALARQWLRYWRTLHLAETLRSGIQIRERESNGSTIEISVVNATAETCGRGHGIAGRRPS